MSYLFPDPPEKTYTQISLDPGDYHFTTKLNNKILTITLSIIKEDHLWGVEGSVQLSSNRQQKTHEIKLTVLDRSESIWIGSWLNVFEKSGVSQNCNPDIEPQDLEHLSNQTLLKIQAHTNAIMISSDYKYEIS